MSFSVLLVDDHQATLLGLRQVISQRSSRLEVVKLTGSGEEAVRYATSTPPDLACIDVGLIGKLDGFATCRALREASPQTEVVIYTAHRGGGIVRQAQEAGALGVVQKSDQFEEIVRALLNATRGLPYRSPGFQDDEVPLLSARQYEILRLLADGLSTDAIAAELGVSLETVRTHIKKLLEKLRARDRAHAVARALRLGLIT